MTNRRQLGARWTLKLSLRGRRIIAKFWNIVFVNLITWEVQVIFIINLISSIVILSLNEKQAFFKNVCQKYMCSFSSLLCVKTFFFLMNQVKQKRKRNFSIHSNPFVYRVVTKIIQLSWTRDRALSRSTPTIIILKVPVLYSWGCFISGSSGTITRGNEVCWNMEKEISSIAVVIIRLCYTRC